MATKKLDILIEHTSQLKSKPPLDQLGFGKFFTDHMFMADYAEGTGWHHPRVAPYQNLLLDPGASILHYGQGLFEGLKAFQGHDGKIRLFRPKMNWQRLVHGTERLCMQAPPWDLFIQGLCAYVQTDADWTPSAPGTSLYLRPTLIGTEAFLGVRPSQQYLFYIIGSPVGAYYAQNTQQENHGIKIWVETENSRCAPGGIGAIKAGGNYASSLLAATKSRNEGYAQVLWLDACQKRFIEEVGTMNVFFQIDNQVITPPLSGTILPGVMRDSVIQLIRKLNLPLIERKISLDEVLEADRAGALQEVFGTGTAASISPVGTLGFHEKVITIHQGRPGPLAQRLLKTITDIQYGLVPDEMNWMMDVTSPLI